MIWFQSILTYRLFQIPETPLWLLSKDRETDALKSLQWLRGWVSPKAVENEFNGLVRYNEVSKSCAKCVKAELKCTHPPPTIREQFKELLRKRNLKPFFLLSFAFFIAQFNGMFAMRPYIVQILKAYGIPVSPNWGTVSDSTAQWSIPDGLMISSVFFAG